MTQSPAQGRPAVPHPQGTIILVLAILSIFTCAITGILALVMAGRVLEEIDANPAGYTNRSTVSAARTIAVIGIILALIIFSFAQGFRTGNY